MKMHLKNIILPAATLLLASAMAGCLKEAFPEDGSASAGQIAGADKTALVAAMPAYLNAGGDEAWDIGFSGFQIFWDAMTEDYPFYEIYRFINNDLLNAEKYLHDTHSVEDKTLPCLVVAYGLHARLWLEMGSRFELYPEDLAKQIENESALEQYEKLGMTSANDCFRKAAEYARMAIGEGFTPVSKSQWFDTSSGFNAPNNSWLWALTVSLNLAIATSDWKSIPSFKSPRLITVCQTAPMAVPK